VNSACEAAGRAATCPTNAITVQHFRRSRRAQIEGLFASLVPA
jgi:hypothetical protein